MRQKMSAMSGTSGNNLGVKKKKKSIDSDIESLINEEDEIVNKRAYFRGATVL